LTILCITGSFGAVVSASMKGVQTVCVFAFSAVFFCRYEETQVRVLVARALTGARAPYNNFCCCWQIHLLVGTIA
jgi:hypothetical protein